MASNMTVEVRPNVGIAIQRPSSLEEGVTFSSETGKANLTFQYDGNLVATGENDVPLFAANTANNQQPGGNGGRTCVFQTDGNLVVSNAAGRPIFATKTADNQQSDGRGGRLLIVQVDGNIVIYSETMKPLFATHTGH